jgi:branched-chain amino acid transport system permease protein
MTAVAKRIGLRPVTGLQSLRRPLVALGIAALVLLPFWAPSSYVVNIAILAMTFAVVCTGLNLIFGYAGLLSFAQVGFWGIGAYVSAICAVDLGLSPWLGFVVGGLVATAIALMIGVPALRVSRASFVIVTLSFTLLMGLLARNWVDVTRGPLGIPGLPAPDVTVPGIGNFSGHDPNVFFYIMLAFAVIAIGSIRLIVTSPVGRALKALNQNEPLARSQGIRATRHQMLAFAVSALVTGMAGGLYVFHLSIVDPTIFDVYYVEMMLIIVILGGPGSFWSVIVASGVFTVIPELLRISPDLRLVLFGAVLVGVALLLPGGFGGWLELRRLKAWRRNLSP